MNMEFAASQGNILIIIIQKNFAYANDFLILPKKKNMFLKHHRHHLQMFITFPVFTLKKSSTHHEYHINLATISLFIYGYLVESSALTRDSAPLIKSRES